MFPWHRTAFELYIAVPKLFMVLCANPSDHNVQTKEVVLFCFFLHEFNDNLGKQAIRSTWHVNEERICGGQR